MEEVLDTTSISEDDKKKYELLPNFNKYFDVKKNIIYEHAQFNQHSQLLDESADHLIMEIQSSR